MSEFRPVIVSLVTKEHRLLRFAIMSAAAAALATSTPIGARSTDERCEAPFARLLGEQIFDRYAASVGKSTPVQPEVRTGEAHLYRTVIREKAKAGPNFAGHYTVIEIGCGAATSCVAIADAHSGRVYFPPNLRSATSLLMDTGKSNVQRLNYRAASRLLIVAGEPNEDQKRAGLSYYQWRGNRLKLLRFVPVSTLCKTQDAR